MAFTSRHSQDRRIQKTKRLLHSALSSLIHEKAYDAIAVKEILGRADVGRSTFYAHYRDKDELLVSGIRDLVSSGFVGRSQSRSRGDSGLWFSLPLFTHIEQQRRSAKERMGATGRAVVHRHLERAVTDLVAEELSLNSNQDARATAGIPVELLARHIAATFVVVLNWWVETDSPLTAAEIDDHFRALAAPVIAAWSSAN
jgi:AcrR family transcriptional regulator